MKTFKLVSLQISEGSEFKEIELDDGLIINKEDDKSTWLIEAFMNQSYLKYFQEKYISNSELLLHVIITKRENDPASFQMKIRTIKKTEKHISVLFEGKLGVTKKDYAELLLNDLLEQGLSGETLLVEFKEKMKIKQKNYMKK